MYVVCVCVCVCTVCVVCGYYVCSVCVCVCTVCIVCGYYVCSVCVCVCVRVHHIPPGITSKTPIAKNMIPLYASSAQRCGV